MFHYHFEWDPSKALANVRKHGVSFEQAATVFNDPLALSMPDQEHSDEEERWLTMGLAANGFLIVIHTHREVSEHEALIRIISALKATKHEQQQYEQGI